MPQGEVQCWTVEPHQQAHDEVFAFGAKWSAHQPGAKHGHKGHAQQGRADHRKGLGEGERMEEFPLLSRQRKDREKCQDDDRHGEEDGTPDLMRRAANDFQARPPPTPCTLFSLFAMADDVLCHDDAGIDQHADGNGDTGERHDVRGNAKRLHQDERDENRNRQGKRDDEDAAKMPEEDDVGQGDEDDFLDERVAQRLDGVLDQSCCDRRTAQW